VTVFPRPVGEEPSRQGPWLRLVRASPEPVSPELALVSPDLAATVRSTPDAFVLGELAQAETPEPDRSDGGGVDGVVRYDTRDLLLERHGLALDLETRAGRRTWRLTLARGEVVEAAGETVPPRIDALLRTLVGDDDLRRVPVRSDSPEIGRLEERIAVQRHSLLAHDAGVRLAADPENLHQLRVASRRLRAFLRVARELVDRGWAGELNEPLRELGRVTGPARDLDVLLERLGREVESLDERERDAAAELLAGLRDDRGALQRQLVSLLDGAAYRGLLERLALPVEAAVEPGRRTLEQLAARELRGLVARVRKLGKEPAAERLHALRIRVKRVRYAAELGGLPGGARTSRVISAATLLQDLLGAHQDAVVAEERIRALAYRIGSPQVAFVAGRLAERQRRRRDELHEQLPAAWRRLRKLTRKQG
jgi:CHAD domain-containing protein